MTYEDWRVRLWEASDPNLYTLDFIDAMVAEGRGQFWATDLSAVITQLFTFPTGFRMTRTFAGAGDMPDLLTNLKPQIEAWAESQGCDACALETRPGWQRKLPDYDLYQVVLLKRLEA